jgi:hypothetical protein
MSLEQQIDRLRKEIKSERLSMSIGELSGLYDRKEIDIHPKFQRILRWSGEQKTKLIESILLRIPVPPVYVAQDALGKWDVVDGVQRLGTVFEFLGVLRDPDGQVRQPLVLRSTKLLPELEGYSFSSTPDAINSFGVPLQLDFRRSRIDVEIILKESDPSTKYELFERLNTGGSMASDQEVRNCVLVWINESLFDWVKGELGNYEHFQKCVQLPERLEDLQYRSELILRFLALHQIEVDNLRGIKDLGEFLNEKNREIAVSEDFDRGSHERTFKETFRLLSEAVEGDAFRKFSKATNSFSGPFLISAFEAVALGVASNIDQWLALAPAKAKDLVSTRVKTLWDQASFVGHIGTGVSAQNRMQKSVPFGRQFFKP